MSDTSKMTPAQLYAHGLACMRQAAEQGYAPGEGPYSLVDPIRDVGKTSGEVVNEVTEVTLRRAQLDDLWATANIDNDEVRTYRLLQRVTGLTEAQARRLGIADTMALAARVDTLFLGRASSPTS